MRCVVAEQVAVDARGPAHQPVGGGALDEFGDVAAVSLSGDREPPVLDERSRVDQIGDVLAGGAPVCRVPAFDRVGAGRVFGQRAPPQQLGVIVADGLVTHRRGLLELDCSAGWNTTRAVGSWART